jgi:Calpain family cysteine protease
MIRVKWSSTANLVATFGFVAALIATASPTRAAESARRDPRTTRRTASRGESQAAQSGAEISPEWFDDLLADPALRALAADRFAAHHRLTRTDMLAIFAAAVDGGTIDEDEFQTLRVLVQTANSLGMPAYVADLSRKVVLGDPANAHFQGEPLGNLEIGSAAEQLDRLVKKWFLGQDPPAIDAKFHYQRAAGVLFDGAPKLFDLHQGDLGDCYYIACLGEVAMRDPQQIARMFIDNHDDTFTVRFFNKGKPYYVTVDRYFPVDAKGRFVYENRGNAPGNAKNVLWVALAEKALAQLNESGWLTTAGKAGENSFLAIGVGGKSRNALPLITGLATARDGLETIGGFTKGELQLANSKKEVPSFLVPTHSYAVVGYDPDRAEVTLFNPWGLHGNKKDIKYGEFTMSWQDFWTDFQNIDHAPLKLKSDTAMPPKNVARNTAAASIATAK